MNIYWSTGFARYGYGIFRNSQNWSIEFWKINLKAFAELNPLREGYTTHSFEKLPYMSIMLEGYFGLNCSLPGIFEFKTICVSPFECKPNLVKLRSGYSDDTELIKI